MKKLWMLSLSLILSQSSCSDDICTDLGYDESNTIYFRLIDANDGSELTEEVPIYSRDSISLTVDGINIIDLVGFRDNLYSEFSVNNREHNLTLFNDSSYVLYLNYQDIDTIRINATNVKDVCSGENVSSIKLFIHNNDTLYNREFNRLFNTIRIEK